MSPPGVAAQNPLEGEPAAFQGTVFSDGLGAVIRAGRRVPAGRSEVGGNPLFVQANEAQQQATDRFSHASVQGVSKVGLFSLG